MTKNIFVTDVNGDIIGTTYPKRAKGLVKNGRACFVGDDTIRMSTSHVPSEIDTISGEKTMKYITFNGNEWLRRDVDISFVTSAIDGSITQALMLGNWDDKEKIAQSKEIMLTPSTDYSFVFWLNGGENESGNETCEFKVAFSNDWENCNVYKLNRGFIRPLLHQKGWELYSLPFRTPDAQEDVSVTFSFVAGRAPMAVLPALEPSAYSDMQDEPDEYEDYRPQRHNIVFKDGWPSISQYGGDKYSTEAIKKKLSLKKSFSFGNNNFNFRFSNSTSDEEDDEELMEELEEQCEEVEDKLDEIEDMISDIEDALDDAEDQLDDAMDDDSGVKGFNPEFSKFMSELGNFKAMISTFNVAFGGLVNTHKHISENLDDKKPDQSKASIAGLMASAEALENEIQGFNDKIQSFSDNISSLCD